MLRVRVAMSALCAVALVLALVQAPVGVRGAVHDGDALQDEEDEGFIDPFGFEEDDELDAAQDDVAVEDEEELQGRGYEYGEEDEDDEEEDEDAEDEAAGTGSGKSRVAMNADAYDEDEFVGVEDLAALRQRRGARAPIPGAKSGARKKGKKQGGRKQQQQQARKPKGPEAQAGAADEASPQAKFLSGSSEFAAEYMALSFAGLFVLVWLRGRRTNRDLAEEWLTATHDVFDTQFAALAAYGQSLSDSDAVLLKENNASYRFYASGRRNCRGMMATVDLRQRHDIFSQAAAMLDLFVDRDTVTLEVSMDSMPPFVFAVVQKREEKRMRKNIPDLADYTKSTPCKNLSSQLGVLSETSEVVDKLVDARVGKVLSDNADLFSSMIFSDCAAPSYAPKQKGVLKFVFNLPEKERMGELAVLTEMALFLVDRVAALSLSSAAEARAVKARKAVEERRLREDDESREEQKQRRREERENQQLTEAQLRKREARARRRRQPRTKMMRT